MADAIIMGEDDVFHKPIRSLHFITGYFAW